MNLHQLAAMAMMSAGISVQRDYPYEPETPSQRIIFGMPRLATFTSERPLTKRQKRRLRAKPKP